MKIVNPFVTGGYVSPDYFCNREKEVEHLLKAIESRRNITLISLRRMGKTGLLKHTAFLLGKNSKPISVLYVDLLPTINAGEMLNTLATALIRLQKGEKNFFEKMLAMLSSLRPKLSVDSLTGQPSIELKVESPDDIQFGFDHVMQFMTGMKKELVFIFDEFQQISNYPEKNTEQLLRTVIQSYPTYPFIFSGSSKHMLEPMFTAANRPFYQSSELMYLDRIARDDYGEFIRNLFQANNRVIDNETLALIFKWTRLHTFYVQYVCNLLYETGEKRINSSLANEIFYRILISYEPLFAGYRNLLPPQQFKLLQAIAAENGITQPTSSGFIKKYNLTSASSVNTSLNALQHKEMIIQENNEWVVYDVFLSRWMEYHFFGE